MADPRRLREILGFGYGAPSPAMSAMEPFHAGVDPAYMPQDVVTESPGEGPSPYVRSGLESLLGLFAPSDRAAAETAGKLNAVADFNPLQGAYDFGKGLGDAVQGGDGLDIAMSMIPGKAAEGLPKAVKAAQQKIRAYHGSRSGQMPNITGDRPFYLTTDKTMAQSYADDVPEGVSPLLAEYDVDPTGYMSRDEYQNILNEHLPPTWAEEGMFPSEAATVEDPAIMRALRERGVKGVSDLWDFGMDGLKERQVMATIDPSSLVPAVKAAQKGIRAYHGSPHDFEKFDLSKIGTGEGAQAYGHGLYFAENEGVAKGYRDALAKIPDNDPVANAYDLVNKYGGDPEKLIRMMQDSPSEMAQGTVEALKSGAYKTYKPPGHIYEVNINADPDAFLDWDKPLSEQPAAKDALLGLLPPPGTSGYYDDRFLAAPTKEGGYEYKADVGRFINELGKGNSTKFTEAMREKGIPGIKYLDAGSRANVDVNDIRGTVSMLETAVRKNPQDSYLADQLASAKQKLQQAEAGGSRNYVVFSDEIIDIVKKYGIAGALGAGLITQQMADQLQAQQGGGQS